MAEHPRMAAGRYQMALVQRKAGQLQDAVQSYSAYVRMMPKDPDGYYGMAETLQLARGTSAGDYLQLREEVHRSPRSALQSKKYVKGCGKKVDQLKQALTASAKPSSETSVAGTQGGLRRRSCGALPSKDRTPGCGAGRRAACRDQAQASC